MDYNDDLIYAKLNKLAKEQYKENLANGWWTPPQDSMLQKLQLVVGEVDEAVEGIRKNLKDDKLPHRKAVEVELADVLIRLADIAGCKGWIILAPRLNPLPEYYSNMITADWTGLGGKFFGITELVVELKNAWRQGAPCDIIYTRTILYVLMLANYLDLDVISAMDEKIEFNKTRPDHVLETRMNGEVGSKAF